MIAEQLEAWPEYKQKERITRALNVATDRAEYLIRRSWPEISAANRAHLVSIVISSIAVFHHDIRERD